MKQMGARPKQINTGPPVISVRPAGDWVIFAWPLMRRPRLAAAVPVVARSSSLNAIGAVALAGLWLAACAPKLGGASGAGGGVGASGSGGAGLGGAASGTGGATGTGGASDAGASTGGRAGGAAGA